MLHLSSSRTPGYSDLTRPNKWARVFNTLDEGAVSALNVGTEGIDGTAIPAKQQLLVGK